MNFAKQLIKQAIKDNHLLTFASLDEPLEIYGKTKNYHKALEEFKAVDYCQVRIYSRMFCHIKPKYKLLDWFSGSAFDDDQESIIDYPCNGYVDNWFKQNDPDNHPYLDI